MYDALPVHGYCSTRKRNQKTNDRKHFRRLYQYPDNFVDGMGILADVFEEDGATLVGFTSTEGYKFNKSRALRGNQWCGLVIDLDNQAELTDKRVKEWCKEIIK